MEIRWIVRNDMPLVLGIEDASFEFPWREADFYDVMRRRNCIGLVAVDGCQPVGFVVYSLSTVRGIELLNLAVDPAWRRRGVGGELLDWLKRKLSLHRYRRIHVMVRERNLDALLFFRAAGFRAIGLVRQHYDQTDEDAIRLEYYHRAEPVPPAAAAGEPSERKSTAATQRRLEF